MRGAIGRNMVEQRTVVSAVVSLRGCGHCGESSENRAVDGSGWVRKGADIREAPK